MSRRKPSEPDEPLTEADAPLTEAAEEAPSVDTPAAPFAPLPPVEPWPTSAAPGGAFADRPEVLVGAAFAGGFVAALILKRLGR